MQSKKAPRARFAQRDLARPAMVNPDVLVATIASGAAASILDRTSVLSVRSSGTLSMTSAQPATPSRVKTEAVTRDRIAASLSEVEPTAQDLPPEQRTTISRALPQPPRRCARTARPRPPLRRAPARSRGPSGRVRPRRRGAAWIQRWNVTASSICARPTRAAFAFTLGSS